MTTTEKLSTVTAVILAGGQARRMGGVDKGLIQLRHRPMIEYVIESLQQQTDHVIINANRNLEIYQDYGFPVIEDDIKDYSGPLAGIASCMKAVTTRYMVTAPCDSPFVPDKLVERLYNTLQTERSEISVVHDGDRMQPVFSLMKVSLLPSLLDYLSSGEKKIDRWFQQHRLALSDFSDQADAFININTEEDILTVEQQLNA